MFRIVSLVLLALVVSVGAAQLPLTIKDVGLMLRAGYSSGTVAQELSRRHFADALDADKEQTLLQAGAAPDLVAALKNGTYAVPAKQAEQAQQQVAKQDQHNALKIESSRKSDATYQAQVARQRNEKSIQPGAGGSNMVGEAVKGDLVRYNNGTLVHADDEALAGKKLIALYFSAHWCGPCRKFTPELVAYYNRVAPQHPEFEVIFFSADRSPFAMQTYMQEANMPWPAIDYAKIESKAALRRYAGKGIPCLVVVDENGKVVSDSYAGGQYLGPAKVLTDLDSIFEKGPGHLAQSR
jgi:nucleoredoxin